MNNTFTFYKTVLPTVNRMNIDYWDTVTSLFDEGKYKESIVALLRYVNPQLPEKTGNKELTEFSIPHGSIVVNIKITDSQLHVSSLFLKLPEQNQIPMLRQIAEINFSPLGLATIVLEGNEMEFRYTCDLNACDPWKMYYVFKEICVNADNYDDEFIQKFKAIRFQEPKITQYPQAKLDEIWNGLQVYLKEATASIAEFENKRQPGYVWDVLFHTFTKVDYFLCPQGTLRTDIENTINHMMNKNFSLQEKNERGKSFLKKLQELKREELSDSIYIADIFIPIRYAANMQNIKDNLNETLTRAQKEVANGDFTGATYSIQYIFLYQLYYSYPPVEVLGAMETALVQVSGKEWKDAANILVKAAQDIMNENFSKNGGTSASTQKKEGNEGESFVKKAKGFLGKIFG